MNVLNILMSNSQTTIFSRFVISLKNIVSNNLSFLSFFYAKRHRKLWPKATVKEGNLGQMSKKFLVYFIDIYFLRNQTKKVTI